MPLDALGLLAWRILSRKLYTTCVLFICRRNHTLFFSSAVSPGKWTPLYNVFLMCNFVVKTVFLKVSPIKFPVQSLIRPLKEEVFHNFWAHLCMWHGGLKCIAFCLSVCHWTIIISESIIAMNLKLYHNIKPLYVHRSIWKWFVIENVANK